MMFRDQSLEMLQSLIDGATDSKNMADTQLRETMSATTQSLVEWGDMQLAMFSTSANAHIDTLESRLMTLAMDFMQIAMDCLEDLDTFLNDLKRRWAWYQFRFFGFRKEPESLYEDYDPEYRDEWVDELFPPGPEDPDPTDEGKDGGCPGGNPLGESEKTC